jgi:serine/threonine-protein kinase
MSFDGRDPITDRWSEVDRLYEEALGMPVMERERFLTEACGADRGLFDTVSRLLTASARFEQALSGLPAEFAEAAFSTPSETGRLQGQDLQVGPYRLLREVQRGGMATVYEAERADGAFTKRVAIKLLRGVDSDLTSRFLAERQILSELSHPHIARILDGGSTERGEPYLVMEWVDGERITRWADEQQLDVPARLELVQQVAEAVQYAHSHLVVHRDIKPSNVLVDADGQVHLLDFGIAKLLDTDHADGPGTRTATRWMTPEYAAPEQLLGQPVTTGTDVYALGVLLHELLTGRRPLQGETPDLRLGLATSERALPTMSSVVDAADLEIAARRGTSPAGLRRALAGDLDAIVAKALRRAPTDRYPTPRDLADDLARHLDARPVEARAGLRTYRARLFLRRHRVGLAVAASVFLALSTATILLARERARVAEAASLAEIEADRGRAVIDFLADIFRGRDPTTAPSDTITARELLAWGTERVESEFDDRPALQAELLLVLGDAHQNLGLLDDAVELLSRSVEIRQETFGHKNEEVAAALSRLGVTYTTQRSFAEAAEVRRAVLDIRRGLATPDQGKTAEAMAALALTLRDLGQPDSAEVLLRQVLEMRSSDSDDQSGAIAARLGLAYVLRSQDRLEEARELYEEGIAAYRTLPEQDPGSLMTHINNLGYVYRVQGEYPAAEAAYREALDLSVPLYGRGHPQTLLFMNNLASVLHAQGRMHEAEEVMRRKVDAARQQWPDGHWRVAQAHESLSSFLLREGDLAAAERHARTAGEQYETLLGPQHDWTSFAYALVAVVGVLSDDPHAGRAFLDRLHAYLEDRLVQGDGRLPPPLINQLEPFLLTLRETGLDAEHSRFSALLAPPEAGDSVGG